MERGRAPSRVRAGQPAARRRAGGADGALAVPAHVAAVRQPAVSASRGRARGRLPVGGGPRCWSRSTRPRCDHSTVDADTLDRDRVWAAKRAALELVHRQPRRESRQRSFDAFRAREAEGLRDFATWCALAERFGLPTSTWPDDVRDPTSSKAEALRDELADRVCFHEWLQWCLDEQLAAAQRAAIEAGMAIGVVHDLAVGVHPDGADSWALSSTLARGVSVGAPPDMYNQLGQDWVMPPWRPDRLAEVGYAPYRAMMRTILRHAGGLRIDHVIGLFRLWWVPPGCRPSDGTYVGYDHEALVGILVLEAHRAGAVVVGEDLGTVEPWTS